MILNIDNLYSVVKKAYDPGYIIIYPDHIIILDTAQTIITDIIGDTYSLCIYNELENISFPIITSIEDLKTNIDFNKGKIKKENEGKSVNDFLRNPDDPFGIYRNDIFNIVMKVYSFVSNKDNNIVNRVNLLENEYVNNLLNGPSTMGAVYLNISGYIISIFKSLFSVTKSDTFDLEIYDNIFNNPDKFICKFITNKIKDKFVMEQYILYKKM